VLLLGYLYAHSLVSAIGRGKQGFVHLVLLAISLCVLPLVNDAGGSPAHAGDPTFHILATLLVSIGLPYFLLSSTGPLLQAWYAEESGTAVPYRLFALSNLGSMAALLVYPPIVEPALTLHVQSRAWSLGYLIFAVACGAIAWSLERNRRLGVTERPIAAVKRPPIRVMLLWLLLAFCPAALLMSVTSHLTENVAPVPLLWMLPLGLYLLTFILCFESSRWYRRRAFIPLCFAGLAAMTIALSLHDQVGGLLALIVLFSASLFAVAMACHGELAALKPEARLLTLFYLVVSAGGMLGGVFVAVLAPRIFDANYELPIGIVVSALVLVVALRGKWTGWIDRKRARLRWALVFCLVGGLALPAAWEAVGVHRASRVMVRNFYGALRVKELGTGTNATRTLYHGRIIHGMQFMASAYHRVPTTYYTEQNGVGMAIVGTRALSPARAQRVGVVGLGAGTVAAYARIGDTYRFYEINPLVLQLARQYFWFLSESPANTQVALGDGRLSLEREPAQGFDVLVVDAFSGDSIPIHLLTKEAFALYLRHLQPNGVLAVHVSNKFLDLAPVVLRAAEAFDKQARSVDTSDEKTGVSYGAEWILVTGSSTFFAQDMLRAAKPIASNASVPLWTDDFASVYQVLRR
jgi:spermidine synthase